MPNEPLKPCPFCSHAGELIPLFSKHTIQLVKCSNEKCGLRYVQMRIDEWQSRTTPAQHIWTATELEAIYDKVEDDDDRDSFQRIADAINERKI